MIVMKHNIETDMLSTSFVFLSSFIFTLNVGAVEQQLNESLLWLKPSTPSITHFVNDSFIIFCETVQKDISAKWTGPGGSSRDNTKGRVHIEQKAGLLALVFEHIATADKGNWTCEAVNGAKTETVARITGSAKRSFELLVNQKISFANTELVQSAREGRDAIVYCIVRGDPVPDISWLYYGESINTSNSTKHKKLSDGLFIKNVTQADAGEYTCRAMRITPTFSDSDQITVLLRIQHKPHWFNNDTSEVQYAYVGGFANITCEALGEPPPSFTWIHDGRATSGENYGIFYTDYGSTLQVHVKDEMQFGDYKCKVANPLGMLERTIKLKRGQKPVGPSRFQLRRLFSNGFELDIRSVKYSNIEENMHTLGYRVEYMSDSDFKYRGGNWSYARKRDFALQRGGRFIISSLEPNTTYLMRAACRNLAGLSDWSTVKIFATLANFARRSLDAFSLKAILILSSGLWLNCFRQLYLDFI